MADSWSMRDADGSVGWRHDPVRQRSSGGKSALRRPIPGARPPGHRRGCRYPPRGTSGDPPGRRGPPVGRRPGWPSRGRHDAVDAGVDRPAAGRSRPGTPPRSDPAAGPDVARRTASWRRGPGWRRSRRAGQRHDLGEGQFGSRRQGPADAIRGPDAPQQQRGDTGERDTHDQQHDPIMSVSAPPNTGRAGCGRHATTRRNLHGTWTLM